MIREFQQFVKMRCGVPAGSRILLAVSGGMDSVVMTHFFHRSGFDAGIAHCNFSLRGQESDGDEAFVAALAADLKMPFHTRTFNTKRHAADGKISIQMAARDMRYEWFEKLRQSSGYDFIATAHHLDDQAETFFINLLRGTGIAGLHGIMPRQACLIRPMLFTGRERIETFVRDNRIAYRTDCSNNEATYLRNKIRHQLLPVLTDLSPGWLNALSTTINHLRDSEQILTRYIELLKSQLILEEKDQFRVPLVPFRACCTATGMAGELLRRFGFSEKTLREVVRHLHAPPGKQFFSPGYRLIIDRENLIIIPRRDFSPEVQILRINGPGEQYDAGQGRILQVDIFPTPAEYQIPCDPSVASLDAGKITFPLLVRKWKKGDAFIPFGLNHRKKVSDLMIDQKIPLHRKEEVLVVESAGEIIWVAGIRISHRYRITQRTGRILQIRLIQ